MFFSSGRKVEEAKMALVGRYLFERLSEEDKKQVLDLANYRLHENNYPKTINELEKKVQWLFYALAMAEMGIEHGLKGFKWHYVKNPLMIQTYENTYWRTAAQMLKSKNPLLALPSNLF